MKDIDIIIEGHECKAWSNVALKRHGAIYVGRPIVRGKTTWRGVRLCAGVCPWAFDDYCTLTNDPRDYEDEKTDLRDPVGYIRTETCLRIEREVEHGETTVSGE